MNPKALENVVEHYFIAYGFAMPDWLIDSFAIGMSAVELTLGVMLLFKIFVRIMSIISVVLIAVFTVITLLNATLFPVEECGCFGALINLSPWQSFAKNMVLLPMSLAIWYNYRREHVFETWLRDVIVTCFILAASFGMTLWTYMHLPFEIFDNPKYKIGTDLNPNKPSDVECGGEVIVYRNKQSGETREFSVDDKAWYEIAADENNWEWVETKVDEEEPETKDTIDFWVGDGETDMTKTILAAPKAYLIFMENDDYDDDVRERFEAVEKYVDVNGGLVVYVTPQSLSKVSRKSVPCYNMDARVMKEMLRADFGLVILEKGKIAEKFNYRDIVL